MPPATAQQDAKYHRREHKGVIQEASQAGLTIAGQLWENSKRQPIDLTPYKRGDAVSVVASETLDGQRRWLLDVELLQPGRPAPKPGEYQLVDDMPDDWPEDESGQVSRAHRLECLRIAAAAVTPWATKHLDEPDSERILGLADHLVAWLAQDR